VSVGRRIPVAERVVPAGHLFLAVRRYADGDVWAALHRADAQDAARPDMSVPHLFAWPVDLAFVAALRVAADAMLAELAAAEADEREAAK